MQINIYEYIKQLAETRYALQADYLYYTTQGLVIRNGPERWIVDSCTKIDNLGRYKITLYHANAIYNVNAKHGKHPGYHKQWTRDLTVQQLLAYIKKHYKKYYK